MQLEVLKQPEYLSPTALFEWETCQFKFYAKRMSGWNLPRKPQSPAMAIGSLFDVFVKRYLAEKLGITNRPHLELSVLMKSVEAHNLKYVDEGKALADKYIEFGFADQLIKAGLEDVELSHQRKLFGNFALGRQISGVPVFGKPDGRLGGRQPLDWKISGYFSKWGASPKQGYLESYDMHTGKALGCHQKVGCNFEEIDESWATQLTIYSWLFGTKECDKPLVAHIEQIAFGKPRCNGERKITLARIKSIISLEFQLKVKERLMDAWLAISNGEIEAPEANQTRCYSYGEECIVGTEGKCPSFRDSYGDPQVRSVLNDIQK